MQTTLKYSQPYTGTRLTYNREAQRRLLLARWDRKDLLPKGVSSEEYMRDFRRDVDEFPPVPDRGYAAYVATFHKHDLDFLCNQCDMHNSQLVQNVQEGLVCENYVNALLDVTQERVLAHRAGKDVVPTLMLEAPAEEAGEEAGEEGMEE